MLERDERDGITSWDLVLDAERRHDIRVTLILDPSLALIVWLHFAPPLTDSFRVSYRQFLRWNDELPFAKFAVSEDDRPVLLAEVPADRLDLDELGLALARLLAICDLTVERSVKWLWPGAKTPPTMTGEARNAALRERYRERLGELGELGELGGAGESGEGGEDAESA